MVNALVTINSSSHQTILIKLDFTSNFSYPIFYQTLTCFSGNKSTFV